METKKVEEQTYVVCEKRQSRKVPLAVCLTNCKEQLLCDNFNEVSRETIIAAAKKLGLVSETPESEPVINVEEEETEELTENEEVKPDTPRVQEEYDDTDVRREVIERRPTIPSDSKAQQLYQQALSLKAEIEVRWFELGKILEELFEGQHYIPLGYTTWRDFCEVALGPLDLKPRAIDYLRMTRKKCDEVGIEREIAGEIGWAKLKEIIPVVTKKNKGHWIDVATQKGTTVQALWGKVQVALGKKTEEEINAKAQYVKVILTLYPDQKKIWDLGMDVGHKVTDSDSDGHVVTGAMIPDFLATYAPGMEVPNRAQVIAITLANVEATFKVKFMGEIVDAETGEILIEGREGSGRISENIP